MGYASLANAGIATLIDSRSTELDIIYGGRGAPNHTRKIDPQDWIALLPAEVNIPAERPQLRAPQRRPPVPRPAYFASDRLLPLAGLRTYAPEEGKGKRIGIGSVTPARTVAGRDRFKLSSR